MTAVHTSKPSEILKYCQYVKKNMKCLRNIISDEKTNPCKPFNSLKEGESIVEWWRFIIVRSHASSDTFTIFDSRKLSEALFDD